MGLIDNFLGNRVRNIVSEIHEQGGRLWYKVLGSETSHKKVSDQKKIDLILDNYVSQFIFTLLAELFSMGRYKLTDANGEEIEQHPLLDQLRSPNFLQNSTQFKYDYYLFRKIFGTVNIYSDSKIPAEGNQMYILKNHLIKWPQFFEKKHSKLFIRPEEINQLDDQVIKYDMDEKIMPMRYHQLIRFFDISNGVKSWWEGPSRIDAVAEIIQNSEKLIKSMGTNFDFSGKFLVSSSEELENLNTMPMSPSEKSSIRKINTSSESVFPVMIPPNIERFVNDPTMLTTLIEAFKETAFLVGKACNVPADVIEMLGKSTYENQEQARAQIVDYNIKPDAMDYCDGILKYFGYNDGSLNLELVYDHLPFMGILEEKKIEVQKIKSEVLLNLIRAGVMPERASEHLGYDFNEFREPYLPSNGEEEQDTEEVEET